MAMSTLRQALVNLHLRVGAVAGAVTAAGILLATHPVYIAMVGTALLFGAMTRVVLIHHPSVHAAVALTMAAALFAAVGFARVVPFVVVVAAIPVGALAVGTGASTILRLVPVATLLLAALDAGGQTGVAAGWATIRPLPLAGLAIGCLLLASVIDRIAPDTATRGRLPELRQLVAGTAVLATAFALAALVVALVPDLPSDGRGGTDAAATVHPGFSGDLDVSGPIDLDEELEVLRIESDVATYWRGTTYDVFDGQVWSNSWLESPRTPTTGPTRTISQRISNRAFPSWVVPTAATPVDASGGSPGFASSWRLDLDETVRSEVPLLRGDTITVVSEVPLVDEARLRASDPRASNWRVPAVAVTDRVADLAHATVAGQPTVYDELLALQELIATRVEYTRDIDQLPPGVDAVEHLLFDSGRGFCEQIGTSLVAMAAAVDIPARLVVGFVPGDRDHLRGEWIVRAGDAHAWVEVYFPGVGWQGFDPTADVPLSADAEVESPWTTILAVVGAVGALALLIWASVKLITWRRRPEPTWAAAATERLIAVARAHGTEVHDRQTVIDIGSQAGLGDVARTISADHFGSGVDAHERAAADAALGTAEAHAPRRGRRRRRRQLT